MIAEFKFGYDAITKDISETIDGEYKLKERKLLIGKDTYEALRRILPTLPEDPIAEKFDSWQTYVADIDVILQYVDNIEIRRPIRTTSVYHSMLDMADKIVDKFHKIERMNEQLFNRKVEVHVPGNELLKINKVHVLQDACTDEVQRHLDDGWRILAVCPQPDQRRPDYIMGRES